MSFSRKWQQGNDLWPLGIRESDGVRAASRPKLRHGSATLRLTRPVPLEVSQVGDPFVRRDSPADLAIVLQGAEPALTSSRRSSSPLVSA